MKFLLACIFSCLLLNLGYAQKTVLSNENPSWINPPTEVVREEVDTKIYSKVDVAALYPGGDSAWNIFVKSTINKAKLKDSIHLPEGNKNFSQIVRIFC